MLIPIASSLYYTPEVIKRPEFWGPIIYSPFLKYKQCFYENIIKNDTNHKNYNATMSQPYSSAYFNSIGKKIHTLPRCGLVTIQFARHILCSISFWCGFVCQGVFFHTSAVLQSTRFTLALLFTNFKLQYLMNYSSDFNNFCRLWFLVVCTTLCWSYKCWSPNF